MKIKSYVIIESIKGTPYVSVFPFTETGFNEAKFFFKKIAKKNNSQNRVKFKSKPHEGEIAIVGNSFISGALNPWSLTLIVSQEV